MEELSASFYTFDPPLKCCVCNEELKEGYSLTPETDEGWKLFEEKFGDISNWVIGECCFGGYCGASGCSTPDNWYNKFIKDKVKCLDARFKKHQENYEKWEQSIEGIHYNLGTIGEATIDDDGYKILIVKTLQRLPKDIREKVLDETLFVFTSGYGTVCELYFPVLPNAKEITQPLILLNFALMKHEGSTEADMMDTVAHEVAHFILGHMSSTDDPECEQKADALSEKWGFKRVYDNYKECERVAKFNKDKVK